MSVAAAGRGEWRVRCGGRWTGGEQDGHGSKSQERVNMVWRKWKGGEQVESTGGEKEKMGGAGRLGCKVGYEVERWKGKGWGGKYMDKEGREKMR